MWLKGKEKLRLMTYIVHGECELNSPSCKLRVGNAENFLCKNYL